jgi:hypothetical protein
MKKRIKSGLKEPTKLNDLVDLVKIQKSPEWKTLMRMGYNRVQYQKDHIVALPELNPIKLAVDKAYDRGIIAGILIVIKNVETAAAQMEKLAEKEE